MEVRLETLRKSEQITYLLRQLYEAYGYRMFRMSKFEEYDFYTKNKDYLTSGQVITFSDLDGKLLALKPDITLSIVKNTRADAACPERVYYSESVYRVSKDIKEFKELYQTGLEYIGRVTPYTNIELVKLALKSLGVISRSYVLDLSHMGFLAGLLGSLNVSAAARETLLGCIEAKNAHELCAAAAAAGIGETDINRLVQLTRLSGSMEETLEKAGSLIVNEPMQTAWDELDSLGRVLEDAGMGNGLRLDFSITNDLKYYNGLMMRGYVEGVPRAVLSGGRYDPLLKRMGKTDLQAIGFAIALDELERYFQKPRAHDCDVVVLYPEGTDLTALNAVVERLVAAGERVAALPAQKGELPEGMRAGRVLKLEGTTVREEEEIHA